ncbi:MAG: response regulator [Anaerolineaceae bacterium]|nr:response regulator [Anaerolineaceae bacterium]
MTPKHALIVEDEASLREAYKEILQMMDWTVSLAENGPQALSHLFTQSNTPELVLLDLHLPLGSGLDVLRRIRAEERLKEIRVVAISADSDRLEEAAPLADGTILKPIDLEQLIELVS